MGFLGGPDFPEDPDDLGPLVPLPGGWQELLEYLANLGFKQIEFAGYGQNAANPGGPAPNPAPGGVTTPESRAAYLAYGRTLRGFLDDFGLEAIGNHGFIPNTWPGPSSPGGGMSTNDYERYQTELEFASILGMPYMGTGGDPTSANNRNIEPWTLAGEKWEALNVLSLRRGGSSCTRTTIAEAYHFLQDGPMVTVTEDRLTGAPIPPTVVRGESGKRLMQHYLDVTDPSLCVVEMDIFWAHVAQHRFRWRYDWEGNRVEDVFDPLAQVAHADEALRPVPRQGRRPHGPGTRGRQRLQDDPVRRPAKRHRLRDVLPRTSAPRGSTTRTTSRTTRPAAAADPGQSLRHAALSARGMKLLRG